MEETIIKVEGLLKKYPMYTQKSDRVKEVFSLTRKKFHKDFYALNNINFEIKKGETIGILGQNGSGKSTLLKILTGVLSPNGGKLFIEGKISALLELGAGFNPEMTGIENIYLNGTIMGYSKEEMEDRIAKIADFAEIGDFINQPVKMYSSGMFARLAFAVAINVEPEILIVDEALSVGDMRFQLKCMDHMKKMLEGGTTVLFVSHDTNSIRRFCTRAIWLNKGEIIRDGDVNDVADKYIDFLKTGVINLEKETSEKENELPFEHKDCIAEIIDIKFRNKTGHVITKAKPHDYMEVELTYDVYEENIDDIVIGIAIKSSDGDYICGLNTLLDDIKVPWKYGRNNIKLIYNSGICVVGGTYEFDAAIMDKTASVNIDYKVCYKKLEITSTYIGEGRLIIPHEWEK